MLPKHISSLKVTVNNVAVITPPLLLSFLLIYWLFIMYNLFSSCLLGHISIEN